MKDYDLYNKKIEQVKTNLARKDNNEAKGESMKNAIEQLKHLAELGGVPDYGNYNAIKTEFKNDNPKLNADSVILSIAPSILLDERPKERELQIKVVSRDLAYSYSVTLFRGEKAEIIAELDNENLISQIQAFIVDASEKFNEQ